VTEAQGELGVQLPADYVQFLRWGDGWEGWVGKSYVRLLGRDDLPWANDADFRLGFPGLIAVGGDGGLETFALDFRLERRRSRRRCHRSEQFRSARYLADRGQLHRCLECIIPRRAGPQVTLPHPD
jgi:hypothetical protein